MPFGRRQKNQSLETLFYGRDFRGICLAVAQAGDNQHWTDRDLDVLADSFWEWKDQGADSAEYVRAALAVIRRLRGRSDDAAQSAVVRVAGNGHSVATSGSGRERGAVAEFVDVLAAAPRHLLTGYAERVLEEH